MHRTSKSQFFNTSALIVAAILLLALFGSLLSSANAQETGQPAVARKIGAIKSVNGNALVLTQDAGPDVPVTVQANARILRIAPGAKDLKDATPIQIQDLQVGDRVRVRGQASADGAIAALEVIVMAHSDVEAHHAQRAAGLAEARPRRPCRQPRRGRRHCHHFRNWVWREENYRSAHFEQDDHSSLCARLGQVRRRQNQHAAGDSARRSTASSWRSQCRWIAADCRRGRNRKLSKYCWNSELCRYGGRHSHRSGPS